MIAELSTNYVKLDNDLLLPYYIYNKLNALNANINDIYKLVKYYNKHIFYTSIKTKILKFAINLFDVDCELWSNPFICIRRFCSNNDIDNNYGGIESIENLDIERSDIKCMLLVDQRPPIDTIAANIDHKHTDSVFKNKLKYSIEYILKAANKNKQLTLIVLSLNKIEYSFNNNIKNIKVARYEASNIFVHFIQTQLGYRHITPSNTKIDIFTSFIRNKEALNIQTIMTNANKVILGGKK